MPSQPLGLASRSSYGYNPGCNHPAMRNEPKVINALLGHLFDAVATARAIEDNIQEGDAPLTRTHYQMFEIELDTIATILKRCVN